MFQLPCFVMTANTVLICMVLVKLFSEGLVKNNEYIRIHGSPQIVRQQKAYIMLMASNSNMPGHPHNT